VELETMYILGWNPLTLGETNGEKGYAHAPVSLQIVAGKWEDENVVEAMARIEKAMGRY
jgi:Asp-tRNA(Asn)/Glu-tRNA(Gln) amidotransferase A subunit family amidase